MRHREEGLDEDERDEQIREVLGLLVSHVLRGQHHAHEHAHQAARQVRHALHERERHHCQ